jgi:hypothetical protein
MKTAPSTKPTYRPVLRLPPLPDDQYEGLRNNIAVNGVLVPIITDGGSPVRLVIDGNQRKRLADEFGSPARRWSAPTSTRRRCGRWPGL